MYQNTPRGGRTPGATPGAGGRGGKPQRKERKEMLHFQFSSDRGNNENVRQIRAAYRAALNGLMRAFYDTREKGPAACARRLFTELDGLPVAVVATMVNISAWDGRISPENARWAASRPGTLDEQTALLLSIFNDDLHRAHLDQIATECRKLDGATA